MAIYLNEKLKYYRKSQDLTQEQIANIFNVSPQSVSRWETGAAYPDIELLPSIASYFNITVDELLGVDKIKDNVRIDEIMKTVTENWSHGLIHDTLILLRNAVREFSNVFILQTSLALTLMQKAESETNHQSKTETLHEAIVILETILEHSTDDSVRSQALFSLSQCYNKIGHKEKAIHMAKKLSPAAGSRDIVLTTIYDDDALCEQLKKNIACFTGMLTDSIAQLVNTSNKYNTQETIALIHKAIDIYQLIYDDGDLGFNHFFMCSYYCRLALEFSHINENNQSLHCLEKAAQHAVAFDTDAQPAHHTSLAVQGLEYTGALLRHEENRNNQCFEVLHHYLNNECFEQFKEDTRFCEILAIMEKHAKSY